MIEVMKEGPYALAIDGSTGTGVEKMNPLTVRIFHPDCGAVTTHVLDMCTSSSPPPLRVYSPKCKKLYRSMIFHGNTVWE